jgi:predicted nucleic-acid-binding protein
MNKKKFATQISPEVLSNLYAYAKQAQKKISDVVEDALEAHLKNVQVRPAFRSAVEQVINQHAEALKRLAK